MKEPVMLETQEVSPGVFCLGACLPVPGFGVLPVNAYLIRGRENVLIDTGLAVLEGAFMRALEQLIDPGALHWIWITHTDADHVGNLEKVLAAAPHARVVTNYLGLGKLGMQGVVPGRVLLLNPGQRLEAGGRTLVGMAPPVYDAPETCAVYDPQNALLFSADAFGALLPAPFETAADIDRETLREGGAAWATVDAPWLHGVDRERFDDVLEKYRGLDLTTVLGSHLPPAHGMTGTLLGMLREAPDRPPFIGPDQAALEKMMAA